MPIKSTIMDGIIYTEISGEINYDDVIKQTDFIFSPKDKIDNKYELHDHTNTEGIKLSTDEIRKVVEYAKGKTQDFQQSFLAIYAPNDFTFGIARIFESFFEIKEISTNAKIFRDKEDAIQFLKSKMSKHG